MTTRFYSKRRSRRRRREDCYTHSHAFADTDQHDRSGASHRCACASRAIDFPDAHARDRRVWRKFGLQRCACHNDGRFTVIGSKDSPCGKLHCRNNNRTDHGANDGTNAANNTSGRQSHGSATTADGVFRARITVSLRVFRDSGRHRSSTGKEQLSRKQQRVFRKIFDGRTKFITRIVRRNYLEQIIGTLQSTILDSCGSVIFRDGGLF